MMQTESATCFKLTNEYMNFKYYDILANLVSGFVVLYILSHEYGIIDFTINTLVLTALAYLIGYLINAVSALLEPLYFFTMGGKPSKILLKEKEGKEYTGYGRIKFYRSKDAIKKAKKELNDSSASIEKIFQHAMSMVNGLDKARVSDFNTKFTFSRVVLSLILCISVLYLPLYYSLWYSWVIALSLIFLAWNRCKENGYYYAREVLNEYLNIN